MLLGVAWLAGLAIQGVGEITALCPGLPVRYFPKRMAPDEWHALIVDFDRVARADDKQRFERYTVIKEASGNASLALALSLVLMISVPVDGYRPLSLFILGSIAALSLGILHHKNAERAAAHAEQVVAKRTE
jgi:hypothetical protein